MTYKRVTAEERGLIYRWLQEGLRQNEIAKRLKRSPGSLSREIKRNTGRRGYRPKQAHEKAQAQARRPGPRRFTDE
jgi:IS30 family transposase